MYIAGECGNNITYVKGVTFNSSRITKAEIVFASELLQDFLAKHAQLIKDSIALKANPVEDLQNWATKNNYDVTNYYGILEQTINDICFKYSDSTENIIITVNVENTEHQLKLNESLNSFKDIVKEYKRVVKDYEDYNAKLMDINTKLTTCSI